MSKCTCGDSHDAPADEEVVEAEKSEALDEPIAELEARRALQGYGSYSRKTQRSHGLLRGNGRRRKS